MHQNVMHQRLQGGVPLPVYINIHVWFSILVAPEMHEREEGTLIYLQSWCHDDPGHGTRNYEMSMVYYLTC